MWIFYGVLRIVSRTLTTYPRHNPNPPLLTLL